MAISSLVVRTGIGAWSDIAHLITRGLDIGAELSIWTPQVPASSAWTPQNASSDTWTPQATGSNTWTRQ